MSNYHLGTGDPLVKYEELNSLQRGTVAIDIETVSLEDRRPLGIGFCIEPDNGFYFTPDSDKIPFHILKNPNITKLFHNGAFDLGVIRKTWDIDATTLVRYNVGSEPAKL